MKKILALLVVLVILIPGCGPITSYPGDQPIEDGYSRHLFPSINSTWWFGTPDLQWLHAFFVNSYTSNITVARTSVVEEWLIVGDNISTDSTYTDNITYTRDIWEDLRTPVTALRVPGAKAPTWTAYRGSQILAFADQAVVGNEEEVYFVLQTTHSYKEGTDLYIHPHYVFSSNQTDATVRWGLSYTWASLDTRFPDETSIYVNGPTFTNDADIHRLASFPSINGTDQVISSMLLCKLWRNSSDVADNYTDDVYLLEIDAHYILNTPGSAEELIK